jgi:HprK-related kinase A
MRDDTLSSYSRLDLSKRLKSRQGLNFDIGPFRVSVRSPLPAIGDHIAEMYAEYPLADGDFADLHFSIETPNLFRALFRKQVNFRFDDEMAFKPLPYIQARPFFEWGLNWCIATTAHQYLIIHAAVVAKNGYCAVIPGHPGAGKSTLCAALVAAGWRLLSDEMALISLDSGKITPVPRPISLKNESISIISQRGGSDVFLGPSFADTHKGTVAHMRAPANSVAASGVTATAAWVVYPGYQRDATLLAKPVTACQSILKLADDSFNLPLLGGAGFEVLANMASACQSYELQYSDLDHAIAWFDELSAPQSGAAVE